MWYKGNDTAFMISQPEQIENFAETFTKRHLREFGFTQPREILVDDVRVRSVGKSIDFRVSSPFQELKTLKLSYLAEDEAVSNRRVYFEKEGWVETYVYHLANLSKGQKIRGPAMVIDETQQSSLTQRAKQ